MKAKDIGFKLFFQIAGFNIFNGTGLPIPGIVEPGIYFTLFLQYCLNNSSDLIGFG